MEISYNHEFELMLKNTGESSECMHIMHNQASQRFKMFSNFINIPVIFLSSAVGFMSAINFNFNGQNYVFGSISILISFLKSIDSFFQLSQRSETHRMIALQYYKINQTITVQLALEKDCRIKANDMYTLINSTLQSIKESEPFIPDSIVKNFRNKFGNSDINKPAICLLELKEIKINKYTKDDHIHKRQSWAISKDSSNFPDNEFGQNIDRSIPREDTQIFNKSEA